MLESEKMKVTGQPTCPENLLEYSRYEHQETRPKALRVLLPETALVLGFGLGLPRQGPHMGEGVPVSSQRWSRASHRFHSMALE